MWAIHIQSLETIYNELQKEISFVFNSTGILCIWILLILDDYNHQPYFCQLFQNQRLS